MAQSDRGFPGTIDRGSAARLKFLEVWEAMDTLNAGATAPSVTWPYMWWADTSANRLRQRNGADSAWIDVMPLAVALDGRYALLSEENSFQQPQEIATRMRVGRVDTGSEGGQIWSRRAADNGGGYYWQTHGPNTTPIFRLMDANGTPTVRAWFTTGGRLHLTADATDADQAVRKGQLDAVLNDVSGVSADIVTTSGTAFDVTGIPSWAREINISLIDVSLSGTDSLLVQIGPSAGIETSGYVSASEQTGSGSTTSTNGFIARMNLSTRAATGIMTLRRDSAGQGWIANHVMTIGSGTMSFGAGYKYVAATLDRIRLTRTGSNTFDAGSFRVDWRR